MIKSGEGRIDHRVAGVSCSEAKIHVVAVDWKLHGVKGGLMAGVTLASLAARYGVSEANMLAWNSLKANARVATGQNLTILVPSQGSRRVSRSTPNKPATTTN